MRANRRFHALSGVFSLALALTLAVLAVACSRERLPERIPPSASAKRARPSAIEDPQDPLAAAESLMICVMSQRTQSAVHTLFNSERNLMMQSFIFF